MDRASAIAHAFSSPSELASKRKRHSSANQALKASARVSGSPDSRPRTARRSGFCRQRAGELKAVLEKKTTAEGAEVMAPRFEVDPLWPKPLPNHWVQGMSVGVSVDPRDHVWIVHRTNTFEPMEIYASAQPPKAECCVPAPPVLEFDEEGNLIGHWGGPGQGYDWPDSNHGITVDYKGNVWIGGNGRGKDRSRFHDNQILKFTQDGKFLMQIGHPTMSQGSNDPDNLKIGR